jgi:hypothetical protein
MIGPIIILVISAVLFVYWLRQSIRMIADARAVEAYATQVAAMVRLNFPRVRTQLHAISLPAACQDLDADYQMLTELLTSTQSTSGFERKAAILGYRLARLRFQVCTALSHQDFRRAAIEEMSDMIQFLAGSLGAVYAQAAPAEVRVR